jgi:hypothetical protein
VLGFDVGAVLGFEVLTGPGALAWG